MKQYINIFLAATALTTASCSESNFENILSGGEKEVISFSMSDEAGSPTSRAASRAGFTAAATRIIARIESEKKDGTSSDVRYTKCIMKADKDGTGGDNGYSKVSYYTDNEKKYWDDAYGRQGQLSVYAVAIPNSIETSKLADNLITGDATWKAEDSPNNSIVWSVSTDQFDNPLAAQDLAYSHNIQDGGKDGRYVWTDGAYPAETGATTHSDGRLVFTPTDGTTGAGHFDKGHMVFKHSLSRLTVNLVEGAGFDGNKTNATDFNFTTTGNNIQLNNMIVGGTLDIKAGTWSSSSTPANISKMAPIGTHNGANGQYMAQMLPGYKFYKDDGTESVKNVMEFVIDDNTYYVTQAMIFTALNTSDNTTSGKVTVKADDNSKNYIEMEQGKNYTFSITVKKTGIENLTATLVPWTDVTAEVIERDNAYFTITTKTATSTACTSFDLYRLNDHTDAITTSGEGGTKYNKGYTDKVSTEGDDKITATNGVYKTPWYWENNKAFYHFRTVKPGTTITAGEESVDGGDYFVISSDATASTDPHWGAPMKSNATLKYSTENGFASSVHNAIGASHDAINILEHHMMANVEIIVRTPVGDNGVDFKTGTDESTTTKVELMNFHNKANVRMGTGLVNGWSELKDEANAVAFTKPGTYDNTQGTEYKTLGAYTYSFVPQTLNRNTGDATTASNYVGLVITTPDANKYYVRELCKTLAASVSNTTTSNQGVSQAINYWYPGHKYVYTVTVSKTGIQKITCSIVDWTTVTGNIDNITLEN